VSRKARTSVEDKNVLYDLIVEPKYNINK